MLQFPTPVDAWLSSIQAPEILVLAKNFEKNL